MEALLYAQAQAAMAGLKGAVLQLLELRGRPMTNAEIGRALGIYAGHVGHEGHISRTILGQLKQEGLAAQDPATKEWTRLLP